MPTVTTSAPKVAVHVFKTMERVFFVMTGCGEQTVSCIVTKTAKAANVIKLPANVLIVTINSGECSVTRTVVKIARDVINKTVNVVCVTKESLEKTVCKTVARTAKVTATKTLVGVTNAPRAIMAIGVIESATVIYPGNVTDIVDTVKNVWMVSGA